MNVWQLLTDRKFSRLLRVRWTGQMTDGIFQSALASFVIFSPERQADALSAALAFAVVLLPYSVIGPFVGTILDRVSRQRAIAYSNLIRAITLTVVSLLIFQGKTGVELTIFVLVAFGVNRLILAGLSAGIPLMIESKHLISANALAVTGGSVCVVLGGGIGLGLRRLLDGVATADHADGYIILAGAVGYLLAALFAAALKKREIGPLDHEIKNASFSQGLIEMREGVKFLRQNMDTARGIAAVAVHRGGITALTLIALLLERNTFNDPADNEAGLAGLSFVLSIAACGFVVGAVIAPYGVRKVGRHRWMRFAMAASTFGPLFIVFTRTPLTLSCAAFVTALFGQSLKVTNDALVQSKIDDIYRGRVFSVYDVVVNGAIVSGAVIAALLLPNTGDAFLVPLIVALLYITAGARLLRGRVFFAPPVK
ncbi:MAG: MFS transporter [Actinobacteria bacterium]|nr:MFS transporter [Actinomycetota bacterium]